MSGDTASGSEAPAVGIDALEAFVGLLAQVEDDDTSDAFYSRLCEGTCRLANMDRAVTSTRPAPGASTSRSSRART
jgi:hypothetical protein